MEKVKTFFLTGKFVAYDLGVGRYKQLVVLLKLC